MPGAIRRRPVSDTIDTTPAGRVAWLIGPWAIDAALAVGGLSAAAAQIFSALRARGQTSGWAVLGDTMISRICGYQVGGDAARRQRLRLVKSGWAIQLDAGGGPSAAAYCPSVPTQAILDALDCGLLHAPRPRGGGPDTAEEAPPDRPEGAPPDITAGVNRNRIQHRNSSSDPEDDNSPAKDEQMPDYMIERVAEKLGAGRIDNLASYIAASALRAGLPGDKKSLERYESRVRTRLEEAAREQTVAREKRQVDADRRMAAQLEASEKQRLADIKALSKNNRD